MKMKRFDRELEEAAKRYAEPASRDTDAVCPPSLDARVSATLSGTGREEKVPTGRKIRWKAVMAVAAAVVLLGGAAVAAPLVMKFLHVGALSAEKLKRLDEVPEGWIGVYTAQDLDRVRDGRWEDYILMNDIEFTEADFAEGGAFEGGWEPIGTHQQPFRGTFNGNGHVVRGLRIDAEDEKYVGLFGICKSMSRTEYEVTTSAALPREEVDPNRMIDIDGDGNTDGYASEDGELIPFSDTTVVYNIVWGEGGCVKNLGIEDAKITAHMSTTGYVGAIAGYADYLLGCYVKSTEIKVSLAVDSGGLGRSAELGVGGAAGGVYLADSCASDARITVDGSADAVCKTVMGDTVCVTRVGGVAGFSSACVTSYFSGEISCDPAMDAGVSFIREDDVPYVLPDSVFCEIYARLYPMVWDRASEAYMKAEDADRITDAVRKAWKNARSLTDPADDDTGKRFTEALGKELSEITVGSNASPYGFDGWLGERFDAFYGSHCATGDRRDVIQNFYLEDVEGEVFYLLDPETKPREYEALSDFISLAFPDGDFMDYCAEHHVKYGTYYCYDLRTDADCSFEGFDFGGIWKTEEGALPTLSIFGG